MSSPRDVALQAAGELRLSGRAVELVDGRKMMAWAHEAEQRNPTAPCPAQHLGDSPAVARWGARLSETSSTLASMPVSMIVSMTMFIRFQEEAT